ncbi:MAG TPA: hypothetical protein VK138_12030 [Acidiferrobacterales bacterium]|nr:hypothetical protein [Acidiferrobacterales bacterium]
MKKGRILVVALFSFLLASTGSLSFARGAGGGGGHAGGASSEHRSEAGQANNNAQSSPTAKRGLNRAEERMSPEGLAHEKATDHQKQGKAKQNKKKEVKKQAANSMDR